MSGGCWIAWPSTPAFEGLGTSTQVFPWTEAELAQRLADNDPFAREILGTGQPLAGSSKWP